MTVCRDKQADQISPRNPVHDFGSFSSGSRWREAPLVRTTATRNWEWRLGTLRFDSRKEVNANPLAIACWFG